MVREAGEVTNEKYAEIMESTGKSSRYYIHGDMVEGFDYVFYCAKCDFFVEQDHFYDMHDKDRQSNYERAFESRRRYNKADPSFRKKRPRPRRAPSLYL